MCIILTHSFQSHVLKYSTGLHELPTSSHTTALIKVFKVSPVSEIIIKNKCKSGRLNGQWHSGNISGLSDWRHRVQSSIPGQGEKGFDSSLNWGNHRKHFLLFIVCRPITGSDYFEEFRIHFISYILI